MHIITYCPAHISQVWPTEYLNRNIDIFLPDVEQELHNYTSWHKELLYIDYCQLAEQGKI